MFNSWLYTDWIVFSHSQFIFTMIVSLLNFSNMLFLKITIKHVWERNFVDYFIISLFIFCISIWSYFYFLFNSTKFKLELDLLVSARGTRYNKRVILFRLRINVHISKYFVHILQQIVFSKDESIKLLSVTFIKFVQIWAFGLNIK